MSESSRARFAKVDAVFGPDRALDIAGDCQDLGVSRPLIVGTASTGTRHAAIFEALSDLDFKLFLEAEPHSPAALIERATDKFRQQNCDAVIAIGGGSSIGIGKALAVSDEATFIALPTTYSGSEATAIYGRRIDGEKRTAIDDRCRPKRIIYDPALSASLPFSMSISSATNCMAHAVDALYAQDAGPVTTTLARKVLETLKSELPKLKTNPHDLDSREALLVAGFLGGTLVSMHGIALHHQLCHVIGGIFGSPHGHNNAAVLPHAVAYNHGAVPTADALLSDVFEDEFPASAIYDFIFELNGNTALGRLGLPDDAPELVTQAQIAHGGYNPRPLDYDPLYLRVKGAIDGVRPTFA
jgi:maleylacetate reductase